MTLADRWQRVRWQLYAPFYDLAVTPFETGRAEAIDRLDLDPDDRILIVGCGTGRDLEYLPETASVTAIDLTPSMVRRTRERAAKLDGDVDAQVGDAQDLPFDDGAFDAVLLHLVLTVVPEPERVVAEADRVLAADGQVSIYDKFVPADTEVSLPRRLLDPVATVLFSTLTGRLEPLLAGTRLEVTSQTWILGGLYTVAIAEPTGGTG